MARAGESETQKKTAEEKRKRYPLTRKRKTDEKTDKLGPRGEVAVYITREINELA